MTKQANAVSGSYQYRAKIPKDNAIGAAHTRRFRTRMMWWKVSGYYNWCPMTVKISARDKDAAIAEAHAIGMSVRECIPMKQKQK